MQKDSDSPPWDSEPTDGSNPVAKTPRRKDPVSMVKNSMRSLDTEQLCRVLPWIMNRINNKIRTNLDEVSKH